MHSWYLIGQAETRGANARTVAEQWEAKAKQNEDLCEARKSPIKLGAYSQGIGEPARTRALATEDPESFLHLVCSAQGVSLQFRSQDFSFSREVSALTVHTYSVAGCQYGADGTGITRTFRSGSRSP